MSDHNLQQPYYYTDDNFQYLFAAELHPTLSSFLPPSTATDFDVPVNLIYESYIHQAAAGPSQIIVPANVNNGSYLQQKYIDRYIIFHSLQTNNCCGITSKFPSFLLPSTATGPYNLSDMSDNYRNNIQTSNSISDYQNNQGFGASIEPYNNESSQTGESCEEAQLKNKNKKTPCKWKDEPTVMLLKYLKKYKKLILELKKRGSTAGKVRMPLWKGASIMLRKNNYNNYSEKQCANRWKNIKQNHEESLNPVVADRTGGLS
ncbi:7891_t:CDS:2 [Funneliformis geosporum]|nr:7891_t:CDS:2 [Funneliformis geosporum]